MTSATQTQEIEIAPVSTTRNNTIGPDISTNSSTRKPPPSTVNNEQSTNSVPTANQTTNTINNKTTITCTMLSLCLSVLLSALDLTIITTAIPSIVGTFNSATGYTWIGGAYTLAYAAVTPIWGTVADIWGRKPVVLIAMAVFLGGSLLCALAPSMDVLLAGRVFQGLGGSGMGIMVNIIISDLFSLRDRGLYLAITSLVWAVGSAVGPVLGGVFATKLSWRWCFWINCKTTSTIPPIVYSLINRSTHRRHLLHRPPSLPPRPQPPNPADNRPKSYRLDRHPPNCRLRTHDPPRPRPWRCNLPLVLSDHNLPDNIWHPMHGSLRSERIQTRPQPRDPILAILHSH